MKLAVIFFPPEPATQGPVDTPSRLSVIKRTFQPQSASVKKKYMCMDIIDIDYAISLLTTCIILQK